MRSRGFSVVAVVLLCACATQRQMVLNDVRAVAKPNLKHLAIAAAAVAASTTLDDEVRDHHPHAESFAKNVEHFGGRDADRVIAAYALAGYLRHNQEEKDVAFDALVSSLLASHVITPALKSVVDRERPNGGEQSFPSNHATDAFAVASVIAAHDDRRWVDILAYGIATSVAYARVEHNAHWFSDVVAGAIIGNTVGRTIVSTNRTRVRITYFPSINLRKSPNR